jgi:hypothetical protein
MAVLNAALREIDVNPALREIDVNAPSPPVR